MTILQHSDSGNLLATRQAPPIISHINGKNPTAIRFDFEASGHEELLRSHGFLGFEDFWNLPHHFVDDVNYRKGGWSGVSLLSLGEGDSRKNYYVKRQVNQFRYSLSLPFGALTFEHEALAIMRNLKLGLPAVDIACWGVRKESGRTKGVLVTPEIGFCSLENILATQQYSTALGVLLYRCGEQLLEMHSFGLQHGALYPKHIYIDQQTGVIQLIDFERARKRSSAHKAMRSDFKQLLKHLKTVPGQFSDMLLGPYQSKYSKLLSELLA
jgi:tRNA A-37 threonylcarbamoyl transferase component Bud32